MPNKVALLQVLQKCSSFSIIFVIDSGHVSLQRGKRFVQELTTLVRLFSDEAYDKEFLSQIIQPLFVKFGEFKTY